jgi:carbamoyltransferase
MVQAYKIKPAQRGRIPTVTHKHRTGRLQTVERSVNPRYWKLLKRFGEISGVPILLNTSFSENEPIVNTPAQALGCFLRTNIDALVMGSFVLQESHNQKSSQEQRPSAAAT